MVKKLCKGKSWSSFMKGKMGPYMRSEGGHGPAIRRMGREWRAFKAKHHCK